MARKTPRPPARAPTAKYDAAGNGRRMAGWKAPSSGPNVAIEGLQTIRNRSRDAERNDWTGAAAAQKWTSALLGVGIVPRFNRVPEGPQRQDLVDLWADFVKGCDADGVLDFYGNQTLGERTRFVAGEFFVRRRDRSTDAPLPVPLQVQLLEPEMVPMWDTVAHPNLPAGNTVRSGIERNRWGRRVAYWFHTDHPGDAKGTIDPTRLIRVLADQVCHVYKPTRIGALRGVPDMASVLARVRNAGDMEDAVLDRQKLANLYVAFITKQIPEDWDGEVDSQTGLPTWYDQEGRPVRPMEPGTVQELLPGESATFANPPEAGIAHSDYMRTVHMGTAAPTGIPYELMSGDLRGVSDRTLRVLILEMRRYMRQHQWQITIHQFCQPVLEWFVDAAVLAGKLPLTLADAAKRAEWAPEGWAHIHPVQDPQGKIMEIEAGLRSRSSVISERGDDRGTVDAERADDKVSEDSHDLAPPPPPADTPAETMALMRELMDRGPSAQAAFVDVMRASLDRPAPAAPNFTAHVHVPAAQVSVEAPTVTVTNEVQTPEVHVAAPEVHVAAPVVHVAAPAVAVTNDVRPAEVVMPARQITSVIQRDAAGGIVNVTQTERDV